MDERVVLGGCQDVAFDSPSLRQCFLGFLCSLLSACNRLFNAQFLKRAEGDLLFVCNSGAQVGQMVIQAAESGERVTADVEAEARLISTNEVVSKFILGLSLKVKNAAKNAAKKGAM